MVNTRPDGVMVWLEKTHAPGRPVTGMVSCPLWPTMVVARLTVTGAVAVTGVSRCGRITFGMMSWTAVKTASVMAMAGTGRGGRTPPAPPRGQPPGAEATGAESPRPDAPGHN